MDTPLFDPLATLTHERDEHQPPFNRIIEDSPIPVMLCANDGQVLLLSHAWVGLSGYSPQELGTFDDWVHLALDRSDPHLAQLLKHEGGLDYRDHAGEWIIRTRTGQKRIWQLYTSSPGQLPDGRRLILIKAIDVTLTHQQKKQLEELTDQLEQKVTQRTEDLEIKRRQLSQLFSELINLEQRERRHLASILHDNLQQQIAAARLQVNQILTCDADMTAAKKRLGAVVDILTEASMICRNLSIELAPPILYEEGLAHALTWLREWFGNKYDFHVDVDCQITDEQINQETAVQLFQSARELLFNVIKHAHTQHARLALQADERYITLTVRDQGSGFRMEHSDWTMQCGFGLHSIRQRIEVMGGCMDVQSIPGQGTQVILFTPVDQSLETDVSA